MSWPTLAQSVQTLDISRYQNWLNAYANRESGRVDFIKLAEANPGVQVIVARAAGSNSGIDPDFQYNYDQGEQAGFHMGAYVNNSPTRSVAMMMKDWWKPAIGARQPKLIWYDCETASGQTPKVVTASVKDGLKALRDTWPAAEIHIYTAAYWWDPNIEHGWEGGEKFALAHYPFFLQDPVTGAWRQARSFKESDPFLPIDNSFTPRKPISVDLANVEDWQFSSEGIVSPIAHPTSPYTDLNYMKRTAVTRIFGGTQPAPEPPAAEPIEVTVSIPAGKATVTVKEI